MAGSLWEWINDWGQYGPDSGVGNGARTYPWGASYGNDAIWNLAGTSHNGTAFTAGLPAAPIRGGGYAYGGDAGVFSFSAYPGPVSSSNEVGFRCGRYRY
jgi:hypothetical protein